MGETEADGTKMANLEEPQAVPAAVSKSPKKSEGYSIFTWLIVLALLGAWMSVAVVWFDLVEYNNVVGTLGKVYDADGDGDFDVEDAKVLLGLKEQIVSENKDKPTKTADTLESYKETGSEEEKNEKPVPDVSLNEDKVAAPSSFQPFDSQESIDSTGELVVEASPEKTLELSATERYQGEDSYYKQLENELADILADENKGSTPDDTPKPKAAETLEAEPTVLPEVASDLTPETVTETSKPQTTTVSPSVDESKPASAPEPEVKKKKPSLLNKFDKTIKAEINAAEKLRKKGKAEEALRAFEALVQKYPQSPRSHYGKAQSEDDMAEKMRSNEMLLKAVNTYREAAELPDAPAELIKTSLKRRADRQQFLGRTKGSLVTLERLVQIFPDDITLKNDLGVAHLLIGDNKGAKQVYEEVLAVAPSDGFAKVHYGFILKSENMIAESIPYLKEGLESGAPGTDDGRFYFHLGDALQRVGEPTRALEWYEAGYRHGHFASVWQRSLYNVAGLRAQPWWTAKETGYVELVRTLERNWMTIRDEALAVLDTKSGLFLPEDENLRDTGDWGQFTLWQQGRKVGSSCQSVPKTCALLERFNEATTCKRGQIKFSVMQPGTHVWPHTGPTNCRLRMHLGLVIPRKGCRIRCTNQTREWEEGKVLIFDDSFEHEVWQDADSYRLIFIVDVWHPELSQSQRHSLSPI
ncbi:aspartyl/asparaginyl beta-hydroxylase isoform X1 [Hemibagrus wyckioides]|uniref:aspartyl/asparaginyl beta-hydroxylase isoform X1 n=1 Tax=Hemibagrus wyckioides TaxID=337641 RepID=UPI00266DA851|nr:aspartyl/asparaginyl beta-hydroxylase isoform X1 [Hemibagrus wyckioides]